MALDFDALDDNLDAHVILHHPEAGTFKFYKSEGLTISGNASYTAPFADFLSNRSTNLQAMQASLSQSLEGVAPKVAEYASFQLGSLKNKSTTTDIWTNSERPQFSLSLFAVRKRMSEESVSKKCSRLISYTYAKGGSGLTKPPGNYNPADGSGTWIMKYGTHFIADKLLLTSASALESQECVPDGTPLYASLTLSLEAWQVVTDAEYRAYTQK